MTEEKQVTKYEDLAQSYGGVWEEMTRPEKRLRILDEIDSTLSRFFYYDRKEDESLPPNSIQIAVKNGILTKDELAEWFADGIMNGGCCAS